MSPRIDKRSHSDILRLLEETPVLHAGKVEHGTRKHYLPAWSAQADNARPLDFGLIMNRLFAKVMVETIARLNRIPEKHFAAFLDKVGVERSPGSPARVPVTFTAVKNAPARAAVPRGTRVATTQTDSAPAVTFETTTEFEMVPSIVQRIVTIDPERDQWRELNVAELTTTSLPILDLVVGGQPIEHSLYLVHDGFMAEGEPRDLLLQFNVSSAGTVAGNISWQRYDKETKQWVIIANVATSGDWLRQTGLSTVRLDDFGGTAPITLSVGKAKRPWIRANFKADSGDKEAVFPTLRDIRIVVLPPSSGGTGLRNATAFYNNAPIDFSNDFFPFGPRPDQNDAFYLSTPVLDNPDPVKDRLITLSIALAPVPGASATTFPDDTLSASLSWQFSHADGSWATLTVNSITPGVTNGEHFRPGNGGLYQLTFTLPPTIGKRRVNRHEGFWIRARIASGDYNVPDPVSIIVRDGGGTTINTFVVTRPGFHAPLISLANFAIDYSTVDTAPNVPLDEVASINLFEYVNHTGDLRSGNQIEPLRQLRDLENPNIASPALYLGFDKTLGGARVSLLTLINDPDLRTLRAELAEETPLLLWEYRNNSGSWRRLESQDSSRALATSGVVTFQVGSDIGNLAEFVPPGDTSTLYWLRARVAAGRLRARRNLAGVYPNTTWATSVFTNRNQIIGSGTGRGTQILRLPRGPVLTGEVLRVREQGVLPDEALASLQARENLHAASINVEPVSLVLPAETDLRTGEQSHWVRWHPVPNDAFSGPQDRHYVFDRVDGVLRFPGLPLPHGRDNVRFDFSRTNQGARARQAATVDAVNQLMSSLPYVAAVTNHVAAEGGNGGETELSSILERGPAVLKHRGRVVTKEDYEALAMEAEPGLALARALPTTNADGIRELGAVTVIIVPDSDDPQPRPSADLIEQVRAYLAARATETIFERVAVIGPDYVEVSVITRIVVASGHLPNTVANDVSTRLSAYFHPLTGNAGQGFSFRAQLHISEVYAFIETIEGVDAVESAGFGGVTDTASVTLGANQLVASGSHEVTFRS